jgi:phosphorylase family protein
VLTMVRIGTCGGLQPWSPIGTYVAAERAVGFDGVPYFYADTERVRDLPLEAALRSQLSWRIDGLRPYAIPADPELTDRITQDDIVRGITIATCSFYGAQGRSLRLPLADPDLNAKVEAFEFDGRQIGNFEMESASLAALAALLGHRALTVCCVIAGRVAKNMNVDYKASIVGLIEKVLERI